MTDTLLALIPQYGVALVVVATFLSCLAIPMPSSLIMLTAGAFAAGGDLSLPLISLAAFGGAVVGDQVGYGIGRWGSKWIEKLTTSNPKRAALFQKAGDFTHKHGGPGIFFSRWLVAPLGPYVNFLSGATRVNWVKFTAWDIAGETVWVSLYVGLGFFFASQIEAVGQILGNLSGALAAGLVTLLLGVFLFKRAKPKKAAG